MGGHRNHDLLAGSYTAVFLVSILHVETFAGNPDLDMHRHNKGPLVTETPALERCFAGGPFQSVEWWRGAQNGRVDSPRCGVVVPMQLDAVP